MKRARTLLAADAKITLFVRLSFARVMIARLFGSRQF
jgi:hypothetical protein